MESEGSFEQFHRYFMNLAGNTEWFGWNTKGYDLMLASTMMALYEMKYTIPRPSTIRKMSNWIIEDGLRYEKAFFQKLAEEYSQSFADKSRTIYRQALASQRHVDVGALNEKSGESDASKTDFMFPLKVIQSYTGLDVVEDDIVKDGDLNRPLTQDELAKLLVYNINDVISTGLIFEEKEYKGKLRDLDTLRETFDFLTKSPKDYGYLKQLSRDATSSQYAGRIINQEGQIKLKDFDCVKYDFPFPDGQWRNVLDHIEQHEENINPSVVEFYRHVEGKDTGSRENYESVLYSSPTGKSTMHVPYNLPNGLTSSAYNTVSWGGSHGGVLKDSYGRDMKSENDAKWFKSFRTLSLKNHTATVDVKDVIHVDFKSYYPTLNIILGVYKVDGYEDTYSQVRKLRYELKDKLTEELLESNPAEYERINDIQNALKLVINGATGASNQHKDYVDLPLDNATLSMRILGNLFIYVLGQRFSNEGGLVISTNTDGLYVANMSMDESQSVVDDFYATYGLELEPELIPRMINKSANERIEYVPESPKPYTIGGDLSRSLGDRIDLASKINYPRVVGKAVLKYIISHEEGEWLLEDVNHAKLRSFIVEQLDDFNPIDWTITLKGNRQRKFYLEDVDGYERSEDESMYSFFDTNLVEQQSTNRVVMTKKGRRIVQYMKGKQEKISGLTSNVVTILNWASELEYTEQWKDNLDIDAYLTWAVNMLDKWHVPAVIPELDGEDNDQEVQEQLTLDDLY